MRKSSQVLGILGGVLLLIGAAVALIHSGVDLVVIGGWVTAGAGVVGVAGGVMAGTKPGWSTVLLATAEAAAGLVAPGVIPGIAEITVVFLAYLAGGAFLLVAAILVFASRNGTNRKDTREPSRSRVYVERLR